MCNSEYKPSVTSIGLFVCAGIVVSYYPQISLLLARKSGDGLSNLFLVLGLVGTLASVSNVIILQRDSVNCCFATSLYHCVQNTLGIIQVSLQSLGFISIVSLVSFYKKQLTFVVIPIVLISALLPLILISQFKLDLIATCFGILSTLTGVLQYFPQVIVTFRSKQFKSLSPATLMMQMPGSFLFAFSLALQPGTNWTSWISFIVCGSLQGLLIVMYFVFPTPLGALEEDEPLLDTETNQGETVEQDV